MIAIVVLTVLWAVIGFGVFLHLYSRVQRNAQWFLLTFICGPIVWIIAFVSFLYVILTPFRKWLYKH